MRLNYVAVTSRICTHNLIHDMRELEQGGVTVNDLQLRCNTTVKTHFNLHCVNCPVRVVEQAYLFGVAGPKDVTGHLGLGIVRLCPQEIGEIREVVAVVDEARDELHFVFEYKDGRVVAVGGDTADEGGVEDQLDVSGLHQGAAVASLAPPADLRHQPRQHGQGGPPVQRGPADVSQREPPVGLGRSALPLIHALHVDPADFRLQRVNSDARTEARFQTRWPLYHPRFAKEEKESALLLPCDRGRALLHLVCNSPHSNRESSCSEDAQHVLDQLNPPLGWTARSARVTYSWRAPLLGPSRRCLHCAAGPKLNSPALYCSGQACLLKRGFGWLLGKHKWP